MSLKGASVAIEKVKNINIKTCFPTAHSPQHCFLSVLFGFYLIFLEKGPWINAVWKMTALYNLKDFA